MATTAIGIDVGGTGVKGAAVDVTSGALVTPVIRLATPDPAEVHAVVEVIGLVVAGVTGHDRGLAGVPLGVALSGDVRDGEHTTGVNLHETWVGAPARSLIRARVGRQLTILNDADAAAIAERRLGAARDVAGVVVLLTFGTGIGSAILAQGQLLPNTGLGQLPFNGEPVELVLSAVSRERRGTGWAEWAADVSTYITLVDELLRPDLVIIGGGIVGAATSFQHLLDVPVETRLAALGNTAGIVGAAIAAVDPTA